MAAGLRPPSLILFIYLNIAGNSPRGSEVGHQISKGSVDGLKVIAISTRTEKAKGIWLSADHFSAHYRTKSYLASPDLIC
jgi:hypothetical protein